MQLDSLDFGEISPHNCLKTNEALSQKYENINNPSDADVFDLEMQATPAISREHALVVHVRED